jgi:hypothetical protein
LRAGLGLGKLSARQISLNKADMTRLASPNATETTMTANPNPIPAEAGYRDAFYELAALMGIPARAKSPQEVWNDEMLPRLKSLLDSASTSAEAGELVARLRERYGPKPIPPCRICGAPLSLSSAGGGSYPKFNCSTLDMDFSAEAGAHYNASEYFHVSGDPDVIEYIALQAATIAQLQAEKGKVRELVEFWFSPWGAAKGEQWEDLSGDRPFDPNVMLDIIRQHLTQDKPHGGEEE